MHHTDGTVLTDKHQQAPGEATMTIHIYSVQGMTCDHCVRSVTQELEAVDGVEQVTVNLSDGTVTVTSSAPLDDIRVGAAVTAAGYELTGG